MSFNHCKALAALALLSLAAACSSAPEPTEPAVPERAVFAKDRLVAWCIVPFDASKRGPKERAEMLNRLGIGSIAYDYRDEHIPSFDQEIAELSGHGVQLNAWWASGIDPDAPLEGSVSLAVETLERNNASADLWIMFDEQALEEISEEERVDRIAAAVDQIAAEIAKVAGRVGLYNHLGWFGEPENQIAVIEKASAENVGIVYNFHHGHEHLGRIAALFEQMKPYLIAVNLNGMTPGGPKILPLGQGESDLEMLKVIRDSGYDGPIGILDHRDEVDSEEALRQNLEGLQALLAELGDEASLATYR